MIFVVAATLIDWFSALICVVGLQLWQLTEITGGLNIYFEINLKNLYIYVIYNRQSGRARACGVIF